LVVVRRQRVQILNRRVSPLTVKLCTWTFALKMRLVRGARRSHLPLCWYRMFRPNVVPLPHISHLVAIARTG